MTVFINSHSKQKIQKTSEQTPSEEGETDTKDTPVSTSRNQNKKVGKKQSESEALKKRMREMYDAVVNHQVSWSRLDTLSLTFIVIKSKFVMKSKSSIVKRSSHTIYGRI